MSEPLSQGEVADVLSSIRRLVADETTASGPAAAEASVGKLILTPALRVVEPEAGPDGAADAPAAAPEPAEGGAGAPDLVASIGAATDRGGEVWESETGDVWSADRDADGVAALVLQAVAEAPAAEGAKALFPDAGDPAAGADLDDALAAAAQDEATVLLPVAPVAVEAEAGAGDAPLAPEAASDAGVAADVPEPAPAVQEVAEGPAPSAEAGAEAPFAEAWPEPAAVPDAGAVEALALRETAAEPAVQEALAEPADEAAPLAAAGDAPAPPAAEAVADAGVTEPVPEPFDHPAETGVQPAEAETAGTFAHRAAAPEMFLDEDDDEGPLDEEALRDLVRDLIREELQGPLGERITRNLRKLVKAEVMRALAAKDLG